MNRRTSDRPNADVSYLEVFSKHDRKSTSQWNSNSSNEESFFDPKSEILWSRERNDHFSENDFFRNFQDSYSDLTERTTSTCSWHNDDFDMNSSNKVKASLQAIEDALYDKQESSLISQSVYKECCEWAIKFPFLRLKGEQVIKPIDDGVNLYSSSGEQHASSKHEDLSSNLQIEGKKMAIHVPEKVFRRATVDATAAGPANEAEEYLEEIFDDDGEYEECLELDFGDTCNRTVQTKFLNETSSVPSLSAMQEKVVEKIALEMWPKVVAVLQKVKETTNSDLSEDFQLPPIVAAIEQQSHIPVRRPRTEGTDMPTPDFPKLNSILTISPKVLQAKRDYGSWRGSLRSSRPNSEIHISHRNHTVPGLGRKNETPKGFGSFSHMNKYRQVHSSTAKTTLREEKEHGDVSLFLPALEEDIPGSDNLLNGLYLEPEIKRSSPAPCVITSLQKKSECFLPPIEGTSHLTSNVKLTRNLFTFFGSQIKYDKDYEGSVGQPISRPNTSASKKLMKYSRNLNHNGHTSFNNTNMTETRKMSEVNSDKQVTIFPIVTSLVPSKEKNIKPKKGLLNSLISGRRR